MHRITISLPAALTAALQREARRRRVPVSQVAREAIEARLGHSSGGEQRHIPFIGIGHSGHGSIAANMDEILEAEWTVDSLIDRDC